MFQAFLMYFVNVFYEFCRFWEKASVAVVYFVPGFSAISVLNSSQNLNSDHAFSASVQLFLVANIFKPKIEIH